MGNSSSGAAKDKPSPSPLLDKHAGTSNCSTIVPGTVTTSASMKLPMPDRDTLEEKFNKVLVSRYAFFCKLQKKG